MEKKAKSIEKHERLERAAKLVLDIGYALHRYGSPAHRLEASLSALSEKLGTEGQFFSTPTSILVSFGPLEKQRTHFIRVDPGDVDLGKQAACDAVIRDILNDRCSIEDGSKRISEIASAPSRYGMITTMAGFAMASAGAAALFQGGPMDMAVSALIGLLIGVLAAITGLYSPSLKVFEALATVLATVVALSAGAFIGWISPFICVLAGVVVLLPGLTLTVALTELATRNLVSGTVRLSSAIVVFLQIGFGVAVGARVGMLLPPVNMLAPPELLPSWLWYFGVLIASIGFTIIFKARVREFPWIFGAIVLSLAGASLGAWLLGPELAAFLGAFVVCTASNIRARIQDVPSSVTIVPGIIVLVPGSLGFRSVSAFLDKDVLFAVDTAFSMGMVAVSLVAGILFANVFIRPRRAL